MAGGAHRDECRNHIQSLCGDLRGIKPCHDGLELDLGKAVKTLRSPKAIALVLGWGWIVGPLLAFGLTRVIPLDPAYVAGLILISMAPTAPFYPLMVRRAKGDVSAGATYKLIAILATVVLLPILAPLLITGLTVDSWSLAKPLIFMVLIPLLVGIAIQAISPAFGKTIFPFVKRAGGIFLLITLALTFWLYGSDMLGAVGSFAPGAQLVFLIAITAMAYAFGFGLTQPQRSSMALAMCTRNVSAMFAGYFGITDPPAGLFVMIILVVPMAALVAFGAARTFSTHAH